MLQATLGEGKKENRANESAIIYVNFDDKKLVIGTLSADKCPQISYDLVFEKGFELSHTWKNGSVFFAGYKVASEGYPSSFHISCFNLLFPHSFFNLFP